MAYNIRSPSADLDEGKVSDYNAASYKMRRLDMLFTLLNEINNNLLVFNMDYNVFNYELKFSVCQQLYQEVESKCTDDERKEAEELMHAIEMFLQKRKIVIKSTKLNKESKLKVDSTAFTIVKKSLYNYEKKIRHLIDDHGMDTKYYDEDDDPY